MVIREARNNTIRRLIVELEKVRMNVKFRHLEVREVIIIPLTGQKKIHTVINICADNQRNGFLRISLHTRHLFIKYIDETVLIDDRRRISNRR
ncbi:MAG: hypothetical protein QGG38_06920 [Nitrospinaceae bacterium]|nr:hypothetical protein [Nitrospinaceae bacterium]